MPIFYITTGVTFDLAALTSLTSTLVLMVVFLAALLLVRGLPGAFAAPPGASLRENISLGLFSATGLPLIVAITAIGVSQDRVNT